MSTHPAGTLQHFHLSIGRIVYPMTYAEHVAAGGTDAELMDILTHVHLAYLPEREGGWNTRKEWKDVLSGGERQRVSDRNQSLFSFPRC